MIVYCCQFNSNHFDTFFIFFIFICFKVIRHNLIIVKSCGGHLVFLQIRPLMKDYFCPSQQKITKLFIEVPVPNFVGLYQYSHLGKGVHGLNMMISIGGHSVFRFLMPEPQHLGHCYFCLIQHNPLRLENLLTKIPTPKLLKRNIIFEIIKLFVKNGGHID